MPDHLHLLLRALELRDLVLRLGRVLSGFTRHIGAERVWHRISEPATIADQAHLLRTVRYIHLNPCREGLVGDPLAWPWSTHRGVMGAEVDPWLNAAELAAALGRPVDGLPKFRASFHGYVSADPSCSVGGTPPRVQRSREPSRSFHSAP